jgi:hypothetical protein
MALPTITIDGILSNIEQARRSGSPGKFVLDWIEKMDKKEHQSEFCAGVVDLIDGFYGDDDDIGKVHCATVVGVIMNSILAAIEAEELEEMFEESA